ncbi:MAG: P-type conjugative transfer protein TrbL [Legionella sp.]|uniref:P-type conjugative transfer protein TrbL n=1 Tax=Legionella sp. TaxID=459 RepID=UPI0039E214E4
MNNKMIHILLLLSLIGLSSSLYAQGVGIDSADLFDNILNRFHTTASHWESQMKSYANWLFWGLVILSMTWTFGLMALRRCDPQEILAELIQFLAVTGFFCWILENGPELTKAIIDSLRQIASKASGLSNTISPSGVVDVGFDIVSKTIDNSSIWSPANTTVGLLVAGIILLVLALVGVNMLIVLISGWFICYGGIFLLGFGGGRWTQDIAINYYKTVLGIALQAFAMVLIIGIGKSFIDQYYAAMSSDMTLKELFVMLVVSSILLTLVNKIPPMLAGIVQGGGAGGGGGVGLGAAMGAASMAAAAMSGGASVVGSAIANAAGVGSALNAAFKAASQSMGSGIMEPLSGSPQELSSNGLMSALSNAGRFAASFGSHLSSGASDVIGDKVDALKESFTARVGETPGGQVADAIHQNMEHDASSFDDGEGMEGSLSAAPDGYGEEVNQFVNKERHAGE